MNYYKKYGLATKMFISAQLLSQVEEVEEVEDMMTSDMI